jgi:chromosome segregation ATPase
MNENSTQEVNSAEEAEPLIRQGKRGGRISPATSTGEREAPRVINILHQRPQPKPPHWRIPADAQARLKDAQAAADKAKEEIAEIEDHFKDRERDLDELKHGIRTQTKGLEDFRQGLARLDPSTLAKEWEAAYWKHVYQPFDQHTTSQWLLVASLRANSLELRKMLTRKLEEGEASIAAMEKRAAELEKELGASIE